MACKPVRTHLFRDFTLARAALLSLLIAVAVGLSPATSATGPLAETKTDPVMRIVPALFHLGKDCDTDLGVRL